MPFQGVHLVLQQDKLHSDKNKIKQAFPKEPDFQLQGTGYINTDKPSPGTLVGVPGECRLQINMTDKSSQGTISKYTMKQTTPHIKPSPGTLHSVHKGTDYTKMNKISPGVPLGAPGDRVQIFRQAFPWYPSRSTNGQTTPGT